MIATAGTWYVVLYILSLIAIVTNSALLAVNDSLRQILESVFGIVIAHPVPDAVKYVEYVVAAVLEVTLPSAALLSPFRLLCTQDRCPLFVVVVGNLMLFLLFMTHGSVLPCSIFSC